MAITAVALAGYAQVRPADEPAPSVARPFRYSSTGPYLWFADEPLARFAYTPDPVGLPTIPYPGHPGEMFYNPTTIAQFGLAHYSHLVTGTGGSRRAVVRAADWLVTNQSSDGAWTYGFDFALHDGSTMHAPWRSAIAQGAGMSLLVRAWHLTRDATYADAARRAVVPLALEVAAGGVRAELLGHIFFEEYPSDPPSFVLNGFLSTLLGLHDAADLGDETAGRLFLEGVATARAVLPLYDVEGAAAYDLLHVTAGPRPALIDHHYDRGLAVLLRSLNSLAPSEQFTYYAERWGPTEP